MSFISDPGGPIVYMQTCQVSRNFRESPEITPDLQVSRKCYKISRNLGNLSDLSFYQQEIAIYGVSKTCVSLPTNITGNHGKILLLPPPHRIASASGDHGKDSRKSKAQLGSSVAVRLMFGQCIPRLWQSIKRLPLG